MAVHNHEFQTNTASSEDHGSQCKGGVDEVVSVLFDLEMRAGEMKSLTVESV